MTPQSFNKAVFLDRDGTLIYDRHYLKDPSDVSAIPGATDGCLALQEAGFKLIVITNQSGIGRGLLTETDFFDCESALEQIFADAGVQFSGHYFCPHHPKEAMGAYLKDCECRKPGAGMILQGAAHFNIDLNRSFMVGDKPSDVAAGRSAGCKTIHFGSADPDPSADLHCTDFSELVLYILEHDQ